MALGPGGTKRRNDSNRKTGGAVGKKISHLIKSEGKPQDQAVAIALNMKREGRLTKEGGYRKVKR